MYTIDRFPPSQAVTGDRGECGRHIYRQCWTATPPANDWASSLRLQHTNWPNTSQRLLLLAFDTLNNSTQNHLADAIGGETPSIFIPRHRVHHVTNTCGSRKVVETLKKLASIFPIVNLKKLDSDLIRRCVGVV